MLGLCYMAGYLGGFAGKLLASGCLSLVVSSDGELGAWWLGWPFIAITHSLVAGCFLLLPRQIKTREDKTEHRELSPVVAPQTDPSQTECSILSEIWGDLTRLMKNKVLIFDSLAMSFWLFGSTNKSYLAKFVEFQFQTSPAAASLFSGSSSLVGMLTALVISISLITWFKPSARVLAGFNFVADILAVLVGVSFIFLSCPHNDIKPGGDCGLDCGCSSTYRPVCDLTNHQTYFSPCLAGCQTRQAPPLHPEIRSEIKETMIDGKIIIIAEASSLQP